MPSNTEQLRKLIVAKCPELLELSFGCEIFHHETDTEWEYLEGIYVGKADDAIKVVYNNNMMYVYHYDNLWHPPQWSHILRCLGEDYAIWGSGFVMKVEYWPTIQDTKYHFVSSFPNPTCEQLLRVDLSKSPLDQSPEIIEQLILLLTK